MRYHRRVKASWWWVLGIAAAVMAPACGDDESGTGGGAGQPTGSGGSDGGSGGGSDTGCPDSGACASEDCPMDASGCTWTCDLTEPCAEVVFTGNNATLAFPYTLADMTASDCVFAALRAGTEGTYRWRVEDATGTYQKARALHVRSGRVALYREENNDSGGPRSAKRGPALLRDASHFVGCEAEANPNNIWGCLEDWQQSCD